MDKESRLSTILKQVNENQEIYNQSIYGIELALKTREWFHIKKCCDKLIAVECENIKLSNEAKQLQIEIENERMEELL